MLVFFACSVLFVVECFVVGYLLCVGCCVLCVGWCVLFGVGGCLCVVCRVMYVVCC